ncbi:MAG: helix-turn-helix domain-containing protein [Candidatus Hermodarchaeota archaeon]
MMLRTRKANLVNGGEAVKLLDIKQLSEIFNVKKKTIYDWVHKNTIPFINWGGLLRFDPKDIEKWLQNKKHRSKSRMNLLCRRKTLRTTDPIPWFFTTSAITSKIKQMQAG